MPNVGAHTLKTLSRLKAEGTCDLCITFVRPASAKLTQASATSASNTLDFGCTLLCWVCHWTSDVLCYAGCVQVYVGMFDATLLCYVWCLRVVVFCYLMLLCTVAQLRSLSKSRKTTGNSAAEDFKR